MKIQSDTRWRLAIAAFLAALAVAILRFSDVLFPLFVAFGLAFACAPIVDWLHRKGVPRTVAVIGILVALVGLFALLIIAVVPALIGEMQGFIQDLPRLVPAALERLSQFAGGYGVTVPNSVHGVAERISTYVQQKASMQALNPMVSAARQIFTGVAGILIAFLNMLIVPIFFFFVCRDFEKTRSYVHQLVPPRHQAYAAKLAGRIEDVLSGYIRGQLLVAAILGVVFSIALSLLGIRFGLFIGILAGFLNIVPYLGQAVGLTLSLLMALVDFEGFQKIFMIAGVFVVTNFLEGHFISPKIVGDRVGLTPLWAILALIVGGKIAGIAGMILAVPTAGVAKVLFREVLLKYKSSVFYAAQTQNQGEIQTP